MTLDSHRNLSKFEQFDVTHLANHATWFFSEYHIIIFEVVTDRFWSVFQLPYCLVGLLHLFFVLQDDTFRYSFYSKINFESGFFFSTGTSVSRIRSQMLLEHWLSVVPRIFTLSSSCTEVPRVSFPTLLEALSECWRCCCECCWCTCQWLLRVNRGAGRGVGSLSYIIRSPFCEVTLQMQSTGTQLCTIIALDFPELQSLILCTG